MKFKIKVDMASSISKLWSVTLEHWISFRDVQMILVSFFEIPYGDRLTKNVQKLRVQVIPRSMVRPTWKVLFCFIDRALTILKCSALYFVSLYSVHNNWIWTKPHLCSSLAFLRPLINEWCFNLALSTPFYPIKSFPMR